MKRMMMILAALMMILAALAMLTGCGSEFQGASVYVDKSNVEVLYVKDTRYQFRRTLSQGAVVSIGAVHSAPGLLQFTPQEGDLVRGRFICNTTEAGAELILDCP